MTEVSHTTNPDIPVDAPHLVVYASRSSRLSTLITSAEITQDVSPSEFTEELTEHLNNINNPPHSTLWSVLTEHDTALDYGYDPATQEAIRNDTEIKDIKASGNPEAGAVIRRRSVAIFIGRILEAGRLGETEYEEDDVVVAEEDSVKVEITPEQWVELEAFAEWYKSLGIPDETEL